MNTVQWIFLVFVATGSFFNALLMFSNPEWFSPFAGSLIATATPFFGAMIGMAMRPNANVTGASPEKDCKHD